MRPILFRGKAELMKFSLTFTILVKFFQVLARFCTQSMTNEDKFGMHKAVKGKSNSD